MRTYPSHWSKARIMWETLPLGEKICTCDRGNRCGLCNFCLSLTDEECGHFFWGSHGTTTLGEGLKMLREHWEKQDAEAARASIEDEARREDARRDALCEEAWREHNARSPGQVAFEKLHSEHPYRDGSQYRPTSWEEIDHYQKLTWEKLASPKAKKTVLHPFTHPFWGVDLANGEDETIIQTNAYFVSRTDTCVGINGFTLTMAEMPAHDCCSRGDAHRQLTSFGVPIREVACAHQTPKELGIGNDTREFSVLYKCYRADLADANVPQSWTFINWLQENKCWIPQIEQKPRQPLKIKPVEHFAPEITRAMEAMAIGGGHLLGSKNAFGE